MTPNKALHLTAIPLRSIAAGELVVGLPEEDDPMAKKKKQLSPKYQVWVDENKGVASTLLTNNQNLSRV